MAVRSGLLSFEFKSHQELVYDPELDHEFGHSLPGQNEAIQPVIMKAFKTIKRCVAKCISSQFAFGQTYLNNINNFLHIATSVIDAEVQHADGTSGQTATILTCRFYRLEPDSRYCVTIDLEEMPSSALTPIETHSLAERDAAGQPPTSGLANVSLALLARELQNKFFPHDDDDHDPPITTVHDQIECLPMLLRGRKDRPHYLMTSDERILEYDFGEVIFHQQSEYQDVKIVDSPTLGKTLLLDNMQCISERDLPYTHTIMKKGQISYFNKRILILGGGDGALLHEILRENPKYVNVVELDMTVIEACREHMAFGAPLCSLIGSNYQVHIEDGLEYLQQCYDDNKMFDYIFNDLTEIPVGKRDQVRLALHPNLVQKEGLWKTVAEIFELSLDCLAKDGAYVTHTTARGNTDALDNFQEILKKSRQPVKYERREAYVPSFMETWVFYTITKDFKRLTRPSHWLLVSRDQRQYHRYKAGNFYGLA